MKTIEQLKTRIKELGKHASQLSRQAAEISTINREQGRILMQQAKDASKRYQTLIQELKRQQQAS
jgi:DNA-binding ferritin-like protein